MEVIGKGTWLDKVAYEIIEREKRIGRSLELIRVESGLGASGIPHLGSLGDAIRAYGIKLSLENLGYRSELIAYSDDMDGLRKVPKGFPDWLHKYIAYPVSSIPDPFGCHESYGAHMSGMLVEALEKLGIEFEFRSGKESYRNGLLNDQIEAILKNASIIGEKIAEMLGQEKFEKVLPYFPMCGKCGRIYLPRAYEYLPKEHKVLYKCEGSVIGGKWVEGCGYEGEVDVRKGMGKLSWKGEFAARWAALDIRFEAYGKDIADSVKVNDWISDKILGHPHPYHVRYEMFLDKSGKKISKSLGNVLTPQAWLKYGGKESLLLLMFKRVAGTRSVSIEDIPKYMDEYDRLEDIYFGMGKVDNKAKEVKLKGLYEYVNLLNPPNSLAPHIPYRLLIQLCQMAPRDGFEFVVNRLKAYGMFKDDERLIERIRLAMNWAKDFQAPRSKPEKLNPDEYEALKELLDFMKLKPSPKEIHNKAFEVSRERGISPKQFFRLLYSIYLGSDRGPRFGNYISDLGTERAISILEQYLKRGP